MALYLSNSTRTRATSPERSKHALASTVRLPHTDPLRHSHSHSHAQSQRHRQCHCQSPQSPQSPPWSPPLEPLKRPRGAPLVGQRLLSPPPPSLLGDPLCVGTCGGSPPAHLLRALSTPRNFQSMAGGSQVSNWPLALTSNGGCHARIPPTAAPLQPMHRLTARVAA